MTDLTTERTTVTFGGYVKAFAVGVEYLLATRATEAGDDGDLNHLIFSSKYAF